MNKEQNINLVKPMLCAAFLLSAGFSKPIRWFDLRWEQFRVFYKIKGYDCDILISPSPQTVGEMSIEQQVDDFSEIKVIELHHVGDWQVFVNCPENHVATFNYKQQLNDFMAICGCPLSCT
jgi:hypothetical protein